MPVPLPWCSYHKGDEHCDLPSHEQDVPHHLVSHVGENAKTATEKKEREDLEKLQSGKA